MCGQTYPRDLCIRIIPSVPFVNYLCLRGGDENMSVYIVKCCPSKLLAQRSALQSWSFSQSPNWLLRKTLTYQISEIACYGLDPCLQNDVTSAAQTAPRVCRRNLQLVSSALTQLLWHWKSTGSMWTCPKVPHCSLHYFRLPLITLKKFLGSFNSFPSGIPQLLERKADN